MKKATLENNEARDASLRVSKSVRDSLKIAAALLGIPLYDVTNAAVNDYLAKLKLDDPLAVIRRNSARVR